MNVILQTKIDITLCSNYTIEFLNTAAFNKQLILKILKVRNYWCYFYIYLTLDDNFFLV